VALLGLVVGALVAVTGVSGPSATPAAAATAAPKTLVGVHTVRTSESGPLSPKNLHAACAPDEVILGGGGRAIEPGTNPARLLTLTRLEPTEHLNGTDIHGYVVEATDVPPGIVGSWTLEAYAICAKASSVDRHHIVVTSTAPNPPSPPVQKLDAVCPSGERELGTGVRINLPNHRVGLQVARTDKLGGLTRAQAHEVGTFTGSWNLVAFAVCGLPPRGFVVPPFGVSPQSGSETIKTATVSCPGSTKLLSAGGAVSNVVPGFATLQSVIPLNDHQARAVAVSSIANPPPWDFIVAAAICADNIPA
jgi:hypothetical protein